MFRVLLINLFFIFSLVAENITPAMQLKKLHELIELQQLTDEQSTQLLNGLKKSCERIEVNLKENACVSDLYVAFLSLKQSENKATAYRTTVPLIMSKLNELIKIGNDYELICTEQEETINLIMNDEQLVGALDAIAGEITKCIQFKSNNEQTNIDSMLMTCKEELAKIAGTFHVMSSTLNATKDGKFPFDVADEQKNTAKIELAQQMTLTIMPLIKQSFDTLSRMEDQATIYHTAGLECLRNYCNELQEFIISSQIIK